MSPTLAIQRVRLMCVTVRQSTAKGSRAERLSGSVRKTLDDSPAFRAWSPLNAELT